MSPPAAKLMSEDEALSQLLAHARAIGDIEHVPIETALGRVLAAAQTSPIDVPSSDNSAMDGYAIRHRDLTAIPAPLPVSQRIAAGATGTPLAASTAARIFTGAAIPPGADTVVMQEHCTRDGDTVTINKPVNAGQNIRRAGEDIKAGTTILSAGIRLAPQHLGLAASVGCATQPVLRRLRVALLITGDELITPGQPLSPGKIYDSNRYVLAGLLRAWGFDVIDPGIVPDSFDAVCAALRDAAANADVIISSGGVSVGEEDHVRNAIEAIGTLQLWRIAIKPGKPLAFGRINETPVIGLPGNPVSVFVTGCLYARPYLLRCQGVTDVLPRFLSVRAAFKRERPDSRREYLRARLTGEGTSMVAEIYPHQGSGVLSSTTWADGFVRVPENQTVTEGQMVDYVPFSTLVQ
ncbi:MAG: molybdopterin biosynthesis protein molybdenum incorporation step [Gammaproteobacteria bacterium]|nr:MAG: molybdopterin biosynthesis protein molybdenum incorporation step [Gammaproteobacteria bacterium]TND04977.1 MAG: molybdopterin biosynthesis protein, molybdenum incorporation step [Gammaproteobacteria bacterium]